VLKDNSQRLSKYFSLLAFLIAFIITVGLMMGDQYGRVNLLYLLLVFVFVPVTSLFITLYSVFFKSQFNLSALFLQLPLWPRDWLDITVELQKAKSRKPWLFYQSQKVALMLSVGALAAFFCTLLLSDVSFVWRSTLLSAEHVFPLLQIVALPWLFIETAQPLMVHVLSSQDSRLTTTAELVGTGVWWRYILMAQLFYVLLPRTVLFIIGQKQLRKVNASLASEALSHDTKSTENEINSDQLEVLQQQRLDLSQATLLNWAVLPAVLQTELVAKYGAPEHCYKIGASASAADIDKALSDPLDKYVIVAAWEPPMGELEDFMRESKGVLLILDWDDDKFQQISPVHLDEWRRFCFPIKNWQLQQLEALV